MTLGFKSMFGILLMALFVARTSSMASHLDYDKAELIHLTHDNCVVLRGPVTGGSIDRAVTSLTKAEGDELYLFIHSPGGSVIAGERLIQTIHALERTSKHVHGIADLALSMGFDILQNCNTRYVTGGSILMQHQMSSGVQGNVKSMNEMMGFTNYIYNTTCQYQADRIGISLEQFQERVNDEWWLYDRQSIEMNAADKSALVLCTPELVDDTEEFILYTWFGPVTLVYSRCPLVTQPVEIRFEWSDNDMAEQCANTLTDDVIHNMSLDYMKTITLVH
jgi:ATP-dependent protease ClpP protease subunit